MALRIAPTKPQAAPEPEGMSVEEALGILDLSGETIGEPDVPMESEPAIPDVPAPIDEQKSNPVVAGYKDPTMGPFLCANCQYYMEDNSCLIVAGFIDEAGVCNLFTQLPDVPMESEPVMELEEGLEELPLE